jgi:hypothetical protein
MAYPIVNVSDAEPEGAEQMGTKRKFWFRRNGERWLFKYNRHGHGEDWSEKIAAECASLLGLPHARVELAVYKDEHGIICPRFLSSRHKQQLVHGNELIVEVVDPAYPCAENFKVTEHTINRAMELLLRKDQAVRLPLDWEAPAGVVAAADLFVGYLLLDALITNTDRHHANWAIIRYLNLADAATHRHLQCLAPTFDHASCLGRELSDDKRRGRLDERHPGFTVAAYAAKPTSRWYRQPDDTKPLNCMDAFRDAASCVPPEAVQAWLHRLRAISDDTLREVVAQVPVARMSNDAREFSLTMLQSNRTNLLRDLNRP